MTRDRVTHEVLQALTERCGLEEADIHLSSHLIDDLHLDSIDAVEISIALEKTFGIDFGDSGLQGVGTVAGLIDRILELAAR